MLWFKHSSDARNSLKLRKVRRKYGADGYAIYWFCLEAIAYEVDKDNLTFDLKEDAETIGFELDIQQHRVEEIMNYMVNVGLFENSNNVITCLKLAERLDKSMTNSPKMRKWLDRKSVMTLPDDVSNSNDDVSTCHERVDIDKSRLDIDIDNIKDISQQSEVDNTQVDIKKPKDAKLINSIFEIYNHVKTEHKPNWRGVSEKTDARTTLVKKQIAKVRKRLKSEGGRVDDTSVKEWFHRFLTALANEKFYSGRPKWQGDEGYTWTFDSLFREKNFVAAIEALNDE